MAGHGEDDKHVKISFVNLVAHSPEGGRSLSSLNFGNHIHGGLRFQIRARLVPYMGYFGPNDVCFNTWLAEFEQIIKTFDRKEQITYTFDEGEQGQPAYLFEKSGQTVYLSIVDSEISDGRGDRQWQRVEFDYEEFKQEYLNFRKLFIAEIKRAAGEAGEEWLEQHLQGRLK